MLAGLNRTLKPGTSLYAGAEDLLNDATAPQSLRAGAAFALASALQASGEHAESFDMLERANKLVDVIYDADQEEAEIAALKRVFAPELLARVPQVERGRGLVFIVGLPRCGSTLTSQILSSHPDAVAVGEFQGIHPLLASYASLCEWPVHPAANVHKLMIVSEVVQFRVP